MRPNLNEVVVYQTHPDAAECLPSRLAVVGVEMVRWNQRLFENPLNLLPADRSPFTAEQNSYIGVHPR